MTLALTRLRQRDERELAKVPYSETYPFGGGSNWSAINQFPQRVGSYQIVQDTGSKHYRPGTLTINPVNMRRMSTSCSSVDLTIPSTRYPIPRISISGPIGVVPPSFPGGTSFSYDHILDPRQREDAAFSVYQKLSTPTADLGVFLGELRESLELLRKPVTTFRKLLSPSMRKHTWKQMQDAMRSGSKLASNISDWWLEYRYGVRPLINDINTFRKLIDDPFHRPNWELRRATRRTDVPTSVQDSSFWVGNVLFYYRDIINVIKKTVAGVYVQPKNSGTVPYSAWDLGLDWTQLLSIGWELVPASFIVDWGIGVGDWLKSMSGINPSIYVIGSYLSDVVKIDTVRIVHSYQSYWGQKGPVSHRAQYSERRLIRTLPVPLPASELRLNENVFANTNRIADALSLAWQRLR